MKPGFVWVQSLLDNSVPQVIDLNTNRRLHLPVDLTRNDNISNYCGRFFNCSIKIDGVRKKKCFDLSENNEVTFSGAGVVEDITSDSIIRETLSNITCVNWRGDILWSFVRTEKLRSYIFDQFSWKNNWISQLTNSAIVCLDRASGEIS